MKIPIPRFKDGRMTPNEELDNWLDPTVPDESTTEEARAARDKAHQEQMTRLGLRD